MEKIHIDSVSRTENISCGRKTTNTTDYTERSWGKTPSRHTEGGRKHLREERGKLKGPQKSNLSGK